MCLIKIPYLLPLEEVTHLYLFCSHAPNDCEQETLVISEVFVYSIHTSLRSERSETKQDCLQGFEIFNLIATDFIFNFFFKISLAWRQHNALKTPENAWIFCYTKISDFKIPCKFDLRVF